VPGYAAATFTPASQAPRATASSPVSSFFVYCIENPVYCVVKPVIPMVINNEKRSQNFFLKCLL
jgi:hypothetical protein